MPTLLLGVFNLTGHAIAVGQPTHIVGNERWAVDPDPVAPHSGAAGMYDSDGADLELTFNATVPGQGVTLFIDIWIRGGTFEKLIVRSSDPANFPIQGSYKLDTPPDFFGCNVRVG